MTNSRSPLTTSQKAVRLFAVFALLLIAAAAFTVWALRSDLPVLTRERLDAAAARWQSSGPADYDLRLEKTGPRPEKVEVKVRGGAPTFLSIDGRIVENAEAREAWSVDGQFGLIERDMESAETAANASQIKLQAEFDPKLGFPLRYLRAEIGQPDVGWRLIEFRRIGEE